MQGANSDNVRNTEASQWSGAPGEYPAVHADYSTRQVKDSTDSMQDSKNVSGSVM